MSRQVDHGERVQHPYQNPPALLDNLLPAPEEDENRRDFPFEVTFEDVEHALWTAEQFEDPSLVFKEYQYLTENGFERLGNATLSQKRRLAQQWLLYGLLSSTVGITKREDIIDCYNHLGGCGFRRKLQLWCNKLQDVKVIENRLKFAAVRIDELDSRASTTENATMEDETLAALLLCVKLVMEYIASVVAARQITPPRAGLLSRRYEPWFSKSLRLADNVRHAWPNADDERQVKLFHVLSPGSSMPCSLTGELLQTWFNQNGWCPVIVKQILRKYDYSIAYYLCRIRTQQPGIDHARCMSALRCEAYDLGTEEQIFYEPAHAPECPNQTDDLVPVQYQDFHKKLCDMVTESKIPICYIDPSAEDEDFNIGIEPYTGRQNFTAISHVWSDGMGNRNKNQIRRCQLRRIKEELQKLEDEKEKALSPVEKIFSLGVSKTPRGHRRLYFWLDTLCIPRKVRRNDNKNDDLREYAMRHITPIFQAADQVLVIDRGIEQQTKLTEDLLSARILSSKWAQRAWTFQEGASVRNVRFKINGQNPAVLQELTSAQKPLWFFGRAFDRQLTKLTAQGQLGIFLELVSCAKRILMGEKLPVSPKSAFWVPLKTIHASTLNDIRKIGTRAGRRNSDKTEYGGSKSDILIHVHNVLIHRSATRREDPLYITANMLNFDASGFSRANVEVHGLPAILRRCGKLPLSLLFNSKLSIYRDVSFIEMNPEHSWIPSRIEGDELFPGATMDVLENGWLSLNIEGVPRVQVLKVEQVIPYGRFQYPHIQTLEVSGNSEKAMGVYVVEHHLPHHRLSPERRVEDSVEYGVEVSHDERIEYYTRAERQLQDQKATLYLIDKSTGSAGLGGYTGRGARLGLIEKSTGRQYVQFVCPITAWTIRQWNTAHSIPQSVNESCRVGGSAIEARDIGHERPKFHLRCGGLNGPKLETRNVFTPTFRHPGSMAMIIATGTMTIVVTIVVVSTIGACFNNCNAMVIPIGIAMGGWFIGSNILFVAITYGYSRYRLRLVRKWLEGYGVSLKPKMEKES
ncbi:uncharacterized protein Z519_09340 [Cladophialophora bantiana CBS 173.52]|uniref:Heterokaryon incompatibility domain-containing protein n=1 Tax=Cladophialophora bantiana (strain ATCC 10958 / CBS 173.52 / CDC B-1940 / NIH 8579) TaxID=1442370 RepID=A0A0D2EIM7_CLAB1|nr:uncharacterized protein Z519_09340 [Cladophialophora bantiana CBS 173.52]KIW89911.1 hypothetical protein Z519_09340 [Cladophialophora bantiana CBS 173.52]